MMYSYNNEILQTTLVTVLMQEQPIAYTYISSVVQDCSNLQKIFSIAGRKFTPQKISAQNLQQLSQINSLTNWEQWSAIELARLSMILQLDINNKDEYINTIKSFYPQADLSELTVLYKALPFYAYSNTWILQCAEGIRSNMGNILEAIMYNNAYPAAYLPEAAWNQMVLKAVFTDKDLSKIYGLKKRNNPQLANALFAYAEERLAAGRGIDGYIWELTDCFNANTTALLKSKFLQYK